MMGDARVPDATRDRLLRAFLVFAGIVCLAVLMPRKGTAVGRA